MGDEALRIADIVRDVEQAEGIEELERPLLVREVDREDCSTGAHLPFGEVVLWVTRERRITNAGQTAIGLESFSEIHRCSMRPRRLEAEVFRDPWREPMR